MIVGPTATEMMASSATGKRTGYLPQLDGLRGIAILSVLLHHFNVHLPAWVDWGPIGVRLFFLLSGYLITLSLWKLVARVAAGEKLGKSLWDFHARRFVRLTPVLYLMLIAGVLLGLPEYREAIWWHVAFLTNIHIVLEGYWPGAASHLWSLSVQEQFYLLWPFVILVVPRRVLPWVLVGLFGLSFALRFVGLANGWSPFVWWVLLPGTIDSFALGSLIACWKKSARPFPLMTGRTGMVVAGVALLCYVGARLLRYATFTSPFLAFTETLENVFLGWLMLRTIEGWPGVMARVFENPVLVYIGKVSFGIYVYHVLVHVVVGPWLDAAGFAPYLLVRAFVLSAISVGLATVTWFLIERPLSTWVRRRESADRKVATPAVVVSAPDPAV